MCTNILVASQTPLAPLPSILIRFLQMMRNVLKRMKCQFFELWGTKQNWGTKMTKNNQSSKNINRKNQKFDFSFDSVESTSSMWISTLTKKKFDFFCSIIETFLKKKSHIFLVEGYIYFFFNSASGPVLDNDLQQILPSPQNEPMTRLKKKSS